MTCQLREKFVPATLWTHTQDRGALKCTTLRPPSPHPSTHTAPAACAPARVSSAGAMNADQAAQAAQLPRRIIKVIALRMVARMAPAMHAACAVSGRSPPAHNTALSLGTPSHSTGDAAPAERTRCDIPCSSSSSASRVGWAGLVGPHPTRVTHPPSCMEWVCACLRSLPCMIMPCSARYQRLALRGQPAVLQCHDFGPPAIAI